MNWLNINFFGMHLLHWLLSGLLPLILIALTTAWMIVGRRLQTKAARTITPLVASIDALSGRSMAHISRTAEIFAGSPDPAYARAFNEMEKASRDLYQSKWLPDPALHFKADHLFTSSAQNAGSLRPSARLLAIGILGSLACLLLQSQIAPPTELLRTGLILLPGLVGLACALLLAANAQRVGQRLNGLLEDLHQNIEYHLPVFNDQAGLALLIDNFLDYDRQMKSTLQEFTATARRLADGDMVDGIRHSVEQVMLGSVAPPIQQAAVTLGNLAGELANRQERGMKDLAVQFADALAADLAGHLQPVNKEIDLMRALMTDVKNYIEYAMRALETTRKQSETLLTDSRDALQQMAQARSQLSADFTQVDGQIRTIADSTSRMAEIYDGSEQALSGSITQFGDRLDQYSRQMTDLMSDALKAMEKARETASDQQESAGLYLGAMQDQVNNLSSRLGADVQDLLSQVHRETGTIADHTSTIGKQMDALNTTLEKSLTDFTQASASYVKKTLTEFDTGLAELASRMARTADEIRDAVDALPHALQQGQGQAARFDG